MTIWKKGDVSRNEDRKVIGDIMLGYITKEGQGTVPRLITDIRKRFPDYPEMQVYDRYVEFVEYGYIEYRGISWTATEKSKHDFASFGHVPNLFERIRKFVCAFMTRRAAGPADASLHPHR